MVSVKTLLSDAEWSVIMVKVKFAQGVYLHLSSRQLVTSEAEVRLLTDLTLLI